MTIHVPDDSVKWQVSETTLVFDGSQDVVFHFVNGTNCFELEAVDLLGIFTGMGGEGDPVTVVPDMTDGFTCDMAAGTLTIDKDALKETLASAVSYNGGTLPDEIAVNARAVTKDGESFYFNRVPYEGSSTVTNTAWWLDISDLDLDGGTEPAPGWVQVEFAGADGASVSEEDADLISSSALGYLQENYADELAALGEGYEVSVRMDIAERGEENIPDEVKEAFSQAAGGSEIGKYYEISVLADVVSGGEAIDGIVHTHSTYATAWAQAGMDIPNIGTTHADYFHNDIPCTDDMTEEEVKGDYELETGNVIIKRFKDINPDHTPGVLVKNHGPFAWGTSPDNAVYNAKVMEQCAKMAFVSFMINPKTTMNPLLIEKHYSRKHGPNAYYGQKKK